jgi:hypothetical protein
MSYCSRVTLPNGTVAIVRHSGKRPPPCIKCGATSTRLCDWKLATRGKRVIRCSAPLCDKCTTSPATDKDLCPAHAAEWGKREAEKTESAPQI